MAETAVSTTGVLKLDIGRCLTAPRRRMKADFAAVAYQCNVARNAMFRAWMRWKEDHPECEDMLPETVVSPKSGKEVKGPMLLYYAGCDTSPTMSAEVVSSLSQGVQSALKSKLPAMAGSTSRYYWQAYHRNEINLASARGLCVPIPRMRSGLAYCGKVCIPGDVQGGTKGEAHRLLQQYAAHACVFAFPLWNAKHREKPTCVVQIGARQLPEGIRRILKRIASGEWKLCDSKLVCKDGVWRIHLTYSQPQRSLELDVDRTAVLEATSRDAADPFVIASPEGRSWRIGRGSMLKSLFGRLESRRRAMRENYPVSGHGRKGHGRDRNERDIKPITQRVRHVLNDAAAQAAAEVVRFCLRHRCGTVAYREPGMQWRHGPACWFGTNGVDWNWTTFKARLSHSCVRAGIELTDVVPGAVAEKPKRRKEG